MLYKPLRINPLVIKGPFNSARSSLGPSARLPPETSPPINGENRDPTESFPFFAASLTRESRDPLRDFLLTIIHGLNSTFFPSPPSPATSPGATTASASVLSRTAFDLSKTASTSTDRHNSFTCPYFPQLKQTIGRDSYSTRWTSPSTKTLEMSGLSRLTNTAIWANRPRVLLPVYNPGVLADESTLTPH
ncbi:hypothetical protein ES319_A10G163000v1 [Gossypium barbadense]|uniref:Uncharacterized protein n=1 Tax=Gossypium barbadense TaxID=3634 RepID=A0A5J5U5R9_GOSBA|nr:hypothetical protein ES319_A10G163000v1 [Gossypium barbadense]